MQYVLCVAADCAGSKVNLKFAFDSYGPSVPQLLSRATEAFNSLFHSRGVLRPFSISAAVIFNDVHSTWDRLERSTQLLHNGQVYLFQPDVIDLPAEIPDPVSGEEYLRNYESPQREGTSTYRSTSPRAALPTSYQTRPYVPYASPTLPPDAYSLAKASAFSGAAEAYHHNHYSGGGGGGVSIFKEEREKMERLLQMPIDDMRGELRREAKTFTTSPEKQQQN